MYVYIVRLCAKLTIGIGWIERCHVTFLYTMHVYICCTVLLYMFVVSVVHFSIEIVSKFLLRLIQMD